MSLDPSIIERYAKLMELKAAVWVARFTLLGFFLGALVGGSPLLAGKIHLIHSAIPSQYGFGLAIAGAAGGAYLGYLVGQSRAVALRLQAHVAVHQLEVERLIRLFSTACGSRCLSPTSPCSPPSPSSRCLSPRRRCPFQRPSRRQLLHRPAAGRSSRGAAGAGADARADACTRRRPGAAARAGAGARARPHVLLPDRPRCPALQPRRPLRFTRHRRRRPPSSRCHPQHPRRSRPPSRLPSRRSRHRRRSSSRSRSPLPPRRPFPPRRRRPPAALRPPAGAAAAAGPAARAAHAARSAAAGPVPVGDTARRRGP